MLTTCSPLFADIDLRCAEQLALLKSFSCIDCSEIVSRIENNQSRYKKHNGRFNYSDALVLHCMIRTMKPAHIIEIGCGMSSCMILDTNEQYFDNNINCTFIDIDTSALKKFCRPTDLCKNIIVESPIQNIDLTSFVSLREGDILFIDSSHLYSPGSDVFDMIHRILPVVRSGVHIHFHDIFYNFQYPTEWNNTDWNEVQILESFLKENPQYTLQCFSSYMSHHYTEEFQQSLPSMNDPHGGSLWLQKV
ncbi:hypothetical protein COU75_03550 [Candidatus Peregrinibacteria bacterium CG10_big_fil_rev_8_21_14_0_10_42_8]|nr:MAG: hypothetical protein COU75_03550 [Candidatus Peregrinibacteria bacterium CG10_big_fil_rev_8_21_14_0_10_42_8]